MAGTHTDVGIVTSPFDPSTSYLPFTLAIYEVYCNIGKLYEYTNINIYSSSHNGEGYPYRVANIRISENKLLQLHSFSHPDRIEFGGLPIKTV